jgi:XTP/dITP diphosphohydrolase
LTLYLASGNQGKLDEFSNAANEHHISVQPVARMNELPPCVEDGSTFEENAIKKALHYSAYISGYVFADDSGLCVDALGGAPGVYSARFASIGGDSVSPSRAAATIAVAVEVTSTALIAGATAFRAADVNAANNARLVHELEAVPGDRRTAHYVCAIALAQAGRVLAITHGEAHGVIISTPRGHGGFGYDPYFLFPPLGKTFAELSPEAKFAVSHRGNAFRKLLYHIGGANRSADK